MANKPAPLSAVILPFACDRIDERRLDGGVWGIQCSLLLVYVAKEITPFVQRRLLKLGDALALVTYQTEVLPH